MMIEHGFNFFSHTATIMLIGHDGVTKCQKAIWMSPF